MALEEGQGHEHFVFRLAEKGSDGKYRGQDSNLHTKRHLILNQACLPISPPRRDRKRVPPVSSFSSRIRRSSILTLREDFFNGFDLFSMNLKLKAEHAVPLVIVEWSENGTHRLLCFPQFFQGSNFLKLLRNGLLKLCELLRTRIARRHHVPLHIKIRIEFRAIPSR